MNVLFEGIFVGFYSLLIYLIVVLFKLDVSIYIIFFKVGFIKHFISYFIGLYSLYCQVGNACIKDNKKNKKSVFPGFLTLFKESILEGFFFLLIGGLLLFFICKKEYVIFLIGFLIHIFSELLGVHKDFCKIRCR